uniref:Potassium channel, subfamily K, member 17 n=1 Tax=Oryzias latipes TaxID=8090 RepID=A0A3P9L0E0_ORYLA
LYRKRCVRPPVSSVRGKMLNLTRVPSILLLGMVYVAYVLIGGVIFWKLEGDLGKKDISNILLNKQKLFSTYTCLNHQGLVDVVIQEASKAGLSLKSNTTTDGFWQFTSSAVFAATVVTTIGYGNMSPSTSAGQIFCVFFALFGIPLNLVVLNKNQLYHFLPPLSQTCTRFFIHLFSYICGTVFFFIVPMTVFQLFEGWTYSQAIYYCFITLSTIGFGDFVADNNPDTDYPNWYSVFMASWIFFGMAWLALLINHSIDILERLNALWKQKWRGQNPEGESSGTICIPVKEVDVLFVIVKLGCGFDSDQQSPLLTQQI